MTTRPTKSLTTTAPTAQEILQEFRQAREEMGHYFRCLRQILIDTKEDQERLERVLNAR